MLLLMVRKWVWGCFVLCSLAMVILPACHDCEPATKRDYLTRFREFAEEVSANCSGYSTEELEQIDHKFQRLSREWYRKFSNQLSTKERVEILAFCGKYFKCRINPKNENWWRELEYLLYGFSPEPSVRMENPSLDYLTPKNQLL